MSFSIVNKLNANLRRISDRFQVAVVSECADQKFGTNFHRTCEVQSLGNSLNVGLRAGYLSVCTAGGASDRRSINGLTYLFIAQY